ncbi:aldehyde dehydrogenase family protein, partial [bacterium]|nr:aldehyde dehydrogenase family protein [bacterium]
MTIPLVIDGEIIETDRAQAPGLEPTALDAPTHSVLLASANLIQRAIRSAESAASDWGNEDKRYDIINRTADLISGQRLALIQAMIANVGKPAAEADSEVTECIDLVRYYAALFKHTQTQFKEPLKGKGPVIVTSPWNFPASIPAGCIAAALITGNPVIFKP